MSETYPEADEPQDTGDDLIRRDENYQPDDIDPVPDEDDEIEVDDGEDVEE